MFYLVRVPIWFSSRLSAVFARVALPNGRRIFSVLSPCFVIRITRIAEDLESIYSSALMEQDYFINDTAQADCGLQLML